VFMILQYIINFRGASDSHRLLMGTPRSSSASRVSRRKIYLSCFWR
jgi:hypothetical protein